MDKNDAPHKILTDTVRKLKDDYGIVLTSLNVDWNEVCIASENSTKEIEYVNPRFEIKAKVEC